MKFSIVLSTQPASFSALAYKGKLRENIKKIKDLGYDGVELAVRDPDLINLADLQNILKEHNLPVPAIGTGQAYGEEHLSFTSEDASIREKAILRIKAQIRLAKILNSQFIIGLIRGSSAGKSGAERREGWLIEALGQCAAEDENVNLVIEPINRYETDLINLTFEGVRLIEKIKMNNVGLLLDTFHMNIEEPSLTESILASQPYLFHFHVADSNRWYPGAGHIDFREILQLLDKIGYYGFISAEILPLPDPDTAAEQTIKHLRSIKI
jgi:sugar phosphate isomerase/epimerase